MSFCLRLKKNHCIETEQSIWKRLDELGIAPGTSLYFQGIRVRKTQPMTGFDVACKWKRNFQRCRVDEAWFILTNLGSLPAAIKAYKQRMGIEQMFRDCKTGGYNLEGSGLKGERLLKMILLMTLAYSIAILQGVQIQKKLVQKYVSRSKECPRKYNRRSTFGIGSDGQQWVNYLEQYEASVQQLMKLSRNKRRFYQEGMRAKTLIESIY